MDGWMDMVACAGGTRAYYGLLYFAFFSLLYFALLYFALL